MRDPKRIDKFCDEFKSIWKDNAPDWRFGQLIRNFQCWLSIKDGTDIYYIEESKMMELFKEFLEISEDC